MKNPFKIDEITKDRRKRRSEFLRLSRQKFMLEPYFASNYNDKSNIDLIAVSFNNPKIVEYQIKLIKKFVKGNYLHIICDNSNLKDRAELIREICVKNDITYIRTNPFLSPNGYSDLHGLALNWIWKNVVKKRQNNFAFLDHDIFPIKNTDIENYLKDTEMFGVIHHRQKIWYLWPGFSFFRYDLLKNLHLNFRRYRLFNIFKMKYMDTGSGNWYPLYSKYDITKIPLLQKSLTWDIVNDCPVNPDKDYGNSLCQQVLVNYFNDKTWLHTICGAEWTDVKGKNDIVYEILEEYLKDGALNEKKD